MPARAVLPVREMSDAELEDLADKLSALESPVGMARSCAGDAFAIRSHHEAISNAFVDLLAGEYDRVILTTPPQVGKSTVASEWAPFWWLCNRPRDRVVVASYGAELANGRGQVVRGMVRQYGGRFGRYLGEGRKVHNWRLTTDGGMRCVGVGGGLTGSRANLMIIDDPHKDRAEADSRTIRNAVHNWYSSTALSRLSPGAPLVIIQTRWHEDDLAGRRIKEEGLIEEGGRWKLLHMPAIAGAHDYLGRAAGEPLEHPLIPRRNKRAALAHWGQKRSESTPRDWGAMYQGDPKPQEGACLSREVIALRTHRGPLPRKHRVGVAVDPSGGGRDVAGIIGGWTDPTGRLFWTHDRSGVMASEQWARAACELAAEIEADRITVEKNYGGDQASTLIKFAWRELRREWDEHNPEPEQSERNPYDRMPPMIMEANSRRGKLLRADPVAGFVVQDRIRFAAGLPELAEEWATWQPDNSDSPGRIDASVHLAYELVKALPAGNVVSSAAGVPKTGRSAAPDPGAAPRGGVAGARIPRAPRPRPGRGPSGTLPG